MSSNKPTHPGNGYRWVEPDEPKSSLGGYRGTSYWQEFNNTWSQEGHWIGRLAKTQLLRTSYTRQQLAELQL